VLHLVEVAAGTGSAWDAVSGTLAVGAALASLAVGTRVLWRTRRRTPGRARRYSRRVLVFVAAVLAFYVVVLPLLLAVGFVHKPRQPVEVADLGRPHEEVSFETSDGLRLSGWYVPSENGAAVIAFPGRKSAVPHARMLAEHGYGVLLLDMRGNGESEGAPDPFGWGSARDLRAGLDYLETRDDLRDGAVGGLGLSVGGELLLETASGDPRLTAVVSEGAGYRTLHEYRLEDGLANLVSTPQSAIIFGALRVLSPESPPEPLDRLVPRISPRAIFLIEAGHGQGGETLNPLYFERAGDPKEHWLIPEASHTGGLEARPGKYERRVVGFFDRYLLGGAPDHS